MSRYTEEGDFHRGMGRTPRHKARHFGCPFCGITFWGSTEADRLEMFISHMAERCPRTVFTGKSRFE